MKMENVKTIVVNTITSLIGTFIINIIVLINLEPNGLYKINYLQVENENLISIELENLTKNIQNNLIFNILDYEDFEINYNGYIDYENKISNTDSTSSLFIIKEVLPNTQVNIVLKGLNDNSKIVFSNAEEMNYKSMDKLVDSQLNNLKNALILSLFLGFPAGVLLSIFTIRSSNKLEKTRLEMRQALEKFEKEKEESDRYFNKSIEEFNKSQEVSNRLQEVSNRLQDRMNNLRLLMSGALHDYNKELNFYKSIISTIIERDKSIEADKLYDLIRNKLETHVTKGFSEEGMNAEDNIKMLEFFNKIYNYESKKGNNEATT